MDTNCISKLSFFPQLLYTPIFDTVFSTGNQSRIFSEQNYKCHYNICNERKRKKKEYSLLFKTSQHRPCKHTVLLHNYSCTCLHMCFHSCVVGQPVRVWDILEGSVFKLQRHTSCSCNICECSQRKIYLFALQEDSLKERGESSRIIKY